jgi:hypothetical protein
MILKKGVKIFPALFYYSITLHNIGMLSSWPTKTQFADVMSRFAFPAPSATFINTAPAYMSFHCITYLEYCAVLKIMTLF